MSSTNSPSLPSYQNHFGNGIAGLRHAAPRGDMILQWIYNLISFLSYLHHTMVQYGQRPEPEESTNVRGITAETSRLESETRVQQHIQQETELRDNRQIDAIETLPSTADEAHETRIFFLKKVHKATSLVLSISGVFGFLQVNMGNERTDPTLKLIYIACNVSLCASFTITIVGVFITCIIHHFQCKTLILYIIIGISIGSAILSFAFVMAFHLRSG